MRTRVSRVLAAVVLLASGLCGTAARAQAPPQVGPPGDPADFRVTTFATGLNFPLSMQQLSDGSLLVGTRGQVLRLVDANHDGVADGPAQVVADHLPSFATSIRTSSNLVFVDTPGSIQVMRLGATPSAPLTSLGSINFAFSNWAHVNFAMAVRDAPGNPGATELYFNVGSQFNAEHSSATAPVSGLIAGSVVGESIYRVTVTEGPGGVNVSDLTQIAMGLRNAAGLAFHPTTGDLYFSDNGINGLVDPTEPLSADELNVLHRSQIGGPVEDFGFAHDYIEYRTGNRIGSGGIQPLVAYQPIPNPFTGSESEGAVEIAFAPALFPEAFRNGVFVGFHGEGESGLGNSENPVVFTDLGTLAYTHFLSNDEPNVLHPDGLLATNDSLFVSDFGSGGNGAIYQIMARPVPEPSGLVLATMCGAGLLGYARLGRTRLARASRGPSGGNTSA